MSNYLPGADSAGSIALTVEQAALRTGLSASHLNKLRVNGGGPPFYKPSRRVIYMPGELDEWMRTRRFANTSQAQAA